MPHLIACRATNPVKEKVREKISMYTNVPMKRVVSMHDVESIYLIPEALRDVGLDREVLTLLNLHDRVDQRNEDRARSRWKWFVDRIGKASKSVHHKKHAPVMTQHVIYVLETAVPVGM